jgi:hypothetical protein
MQSCASVSLPLLGPFDVSLLLLVVPARMRVCATMPPPSQQMDDGCVVYVNGVEIGRVNMPTGAIVYSTLASSLYSGTTAALSLTYNKLVIPEVCRSRDMGGAGTAEHVRVPSGTFAALWDAYRLPAHSCGPVPCLRLLALLCPHCVHHANPACL